MADRILIIEDDPRLAEMVSDYLGGAGFRLTTAGTGREAEAMLKRETFDAIILDLMRRSTAEHPNGLTDFVLVRTIEHLRDDTLCESLSLNFATMRAVLAGERGGVGSSVQRSVLTRMSDSMQIESLWRYTAKFRPRWQPRFLAYDSSEHLASIGVAVARAESFWELPVVGGLFTPAATSGAPLCG